LVGFPVWIERVLLPPTRPAYLQNAAGA